MSDYRVGIVCEGPTDKIVIEAILRKLEGELNGKRFHPVTRLQPLDSDAFGGFGNTGSGWGGVYRWCKLSRKNGDGFLSNDPDIQHMDLIIYHLDADVSMFSYKDENILPDRDAKDLPCNEKCPPVSASVDRLKDVLLSWMGEESLPSKTLFCIPAQNIETWVVATLYPNATILHPEDRECSDDGIHFLYSLPKNEKMVEKKDSKFKKKKRHYENRSHEISDGWQNAVDILSEANRFDHNLRKYIESMTDAIG